MQHVESGRPQVVAHRGASADFPEHTLAAYAAALDRGAEGLECDVRLTSDHELVCVHDRTVDRTSNGSGVVSAMSLAELSRLDFSSWKDPTGPGADGVLTLRRLLELIASHDRPVDLAVETKHPIRFGPLLERRLADLLREFGMHTGTSPVRVMSFSLAALIRMKRLLPSLELVYLFDQPWRHRVMRALPAQGWIAGPGLELVLRSPVVRRSLVDSGRRVHVWTANAPVDWEFLCDLGVEAIITDRPGEARRFLTGPGRRFSD